MLLLAAAWADVRSRRIPNALPLALLPCGAAVCLLDPLAPPLVSSIAAFGVVLALGILGWRLRLCGGGDAKLAAAAATWVGLSRLPAFALATALVGGALSVGCYVLSAADARRAIRANFFAPRAPGTPSLVAAPSRGRIAVPYGVAISAGALYAVLGAAP
jgi:prepilin peptidase CpaA